ncbi:MAG: NAD(P)-dependent alcohol dehydrogenase [Deltaproteobacteria bacterium]|nr:NAD(P)-dependent alcohol dehydrogenase [Deltaproteobacteria bacterium]
MKAFELRPGHPDDALTLVTRPSPALGPADVRVRVRAVSLNYRDLAILRGAASRTAPVVPLSDGAGEVVEVGAAVTRWRVGDRVTASFFPTWHHGELSEAAHAQALGGSRDGMLAEEVVLPEAAWVRIPAHLSFEQAATLPCAGVTAYQALFEATHLTPGDTVLVQGSGGVSIFALQLARAAGARVVATSKSAAKAERLRALGASDVIDYRAVPAWGAAVRELTGGVDVAVEVGGAGTFDQSVQALRFGGTMSLIGVLTGARGEVDLHAMFRKRLKVAGVYVGSVEMAEHFARILAHTSIEPIIDQVFEFADARAAYARLATGEHFGKLVVRV